MSEVDEAIFRRFAEVLDARDERERNLEDRANEYWTERERADDLENKLLDSEAREAVLQGKLQAVRIAENPAEAAKALGHLESLKNLIKTFYKVSDSTADHYALHHYEKISEFLTVLANSSVVD